MTIDVTGREELIRTYRSGLLEDVLPFWLEHAVDREHGGFMTALDRDGHRRHGQGRLAAGAVHVVAGGIV